ncbi:MAG: FHA domain-containing protein [Candidatus Pacearchaeota archaeon]|nr:FHA domain-containing protein [Candidatus Pacearchaeota archaeon]
MIIKMPHAFLTDTITGKRHDLTALLQQDGELITIGRPGKGALIELGFGISIETEKTKELAIAKLMALHNLATVSGKHATIRYMGKFFYIKDHSTNKTKINDYVLEREERVLVNGNNLFFGSYGPVKVEIEDN